MQFLSSADVLLPFRTIQRKVYLKVLNPIMEWDYSHPVKYKTFLMGYCGSSMMDTGNETC